MPTSMPTLTQALAACAMILTTACGEAVVSSATSSYDANVPVAGPRDAVTVVSVFSDYRCGHCRAFHAVLDGFRRDNPNVRIVYRDWPVLGAQSEQAARWAIASAMQGRHAAFHDALMAAPEEMNANDLARAAARAGVDMDRLHRDLDVREDAIDATLRETDALARSYGLQGTPGIVIGKLVIPGAIDRATLDKAVVAIRNQSSNAIGMN
ncbi:DsbA family protein [Sphingomonas donggukensis]|uniref:DsbA family protein n=1 Tax=Sphingomonas donggukensis TaxID=2949093 RepID=A0ABY4TSG9_9SPHN|nr:DsbA family protein [Sphingomonas donggukensis]URW74874.1 DsbA family protein [Sphingomonas donggukensis]